MFRITLTVTLVVFAGAASAQHADVIEHGKKVYATQKCQICHSIEGKGNKNGPLDDAGSKLKPEEIRQWIVDAPTMSAHAKSTRKPPMKAYPNIAKEDLDALVTYLSTLKK